MLQATIEKEDVWRIAVKGAMGAQKNGSRGPLVSQLRPLAQLPENGPESNSTDTGKRREKPLCWKPGF
jgi:hypothetical protein